MPHQTHSQWFDHPILCWRVQIMTFLNVRFSTAFSYFLPPGPRYRPYSRKTAACIFPVSFIHVSSETFQTKLHSPLLVGHNDDAANNMKATPIQIPHFPTCSNVLKCNKNIQNFVRIGTNFRSAYTWTSWLKIKSFSLQFLQISRVKLCPKAFRIQI